VAKINPVKAKQEADKLEKAGRLDQAIALYRQVLDENPRDWNTSNKVGDLYAKLNKNREASVEYAKVADFYAKDGFLLKAIAIWKKINKLDASALDPYLNLADLYAKQGLMMEAKSQYQIVVEEYLKRGKSRDAGEVLKKMADIDPGDLKIRSRLADIYTRDGNAAKAVEEHVAIAEELNKKGHLAESLQVLEKGLKLEPKSSKIRVELARVHVIQKNYERAVHYLEEAIQQSPNDVPTLLKLGEAYLGAKKIEEAEAIFKRLLEINPQDQESRAQMGRVYLMQGQLDGAYEQFVPVVDRYLERREGEKAAALLQQVVQRDPSHVRSLVKLVEVYRQLQKEAQVVSAYSQLTEAYLKHGQYEQAASVLEILVSMEPQNQQHKTKLEFVLGKTSNESGYAATTPAEPRGDLEEEFELTAPDEEPFAVQVEERTETPTAVAPRSVPSMEAPTRPPVEITGPLSEEDQEFIAEHLAEGKVFRKYGLIDKAADQFEAIIARFSDSIEARQELREVFKEKGQPINAAEQCLALAEIFRLKGDTASAEAQEAEAQSLAPEAVGAFASPPTPGAKAREESAGGEGGLALEVDESGLESPPLDLSAELEGPSLELEGGEEELSATFLEEEEPAAEAALEQDPLADEDVVIPLASAEESAELPLDLTPEALSLDEPGPARPPAPLVAAPMTVPSEPPSGVVPADLQKVLREVDTYVSLGFVEDAKEALHEVALRYPDHPALIDKMAEIGLDRETVEEALLPESPPPQAEPLLGVDPMDELALSEESPHPPTAEPEFQPLPGEAEGIDLGSELGDLFSAQSAVEEPPIETASTDLGDTGLADIFKEFKKGVDKQLSKEDYDTRYNLGIAYKEMGLVDEAIAEFQLAAKDENRLLECSSMLGICFMEKGMPKLAIKWFEKGLKAPGRSEEEYQGLRYDLAMAHEAAGEVEKALNIFTDLYGQDANFRDVAAKVRELKGASR